MTDAIEEKTVPKPIIIVALLIRFATLLIVLFFVYGIFAYLWLDAAHPINVALSVAGVQKPLFLRTSEFGLMVLPSVLFSIITAVFLYFGLAMYTVFGALSLIELLTAGSFKQYEIVKAAAIAKAKEKDFESYAAPVDMPQFTKEEWYEILSAVQGDMVRNFDALHGPINVHPAVRERTERSVLIMGDVCTIIAKRLTGTEDLLTQSFKAARIKSNGQMGALPRAKTKESNS